MASKTCKVVARMTIRRDGKLIKTVEVRTDASHFDFYHWIKYDRRGRRTSKSGTSYRGDGTKYMQGVGLQALADKYFTNGEVVKITVLKKKLYQHLITCATHLLPVYKPVDVGNHFQIKQLKPWLIKGFPTAESVLARLNNQPIPVIFPKRKAGALHE